MEKISFLQFRNKVARYSKLNRHQIAVLAPIIYGLDDRYFSACNQFLDNGIETDIVFDEYSISAIKKTMDCSYVEALVILSNLEKYPDYACYIYAPRSVE